MPIRALVVIALASARLAAADPAVDPKALLAAGQHFEQVGDWASARATYAKLEHDKAYAALAVYREANAAFQAGALDDALALATRAATMSGPTQFEAKFLYGDVLFRRSEYQRAKDVYLTLRGQVDGDRRAIATRKVIACNHALKLADADGLPKP